MAQFVRNASIYLPAHNATERAQQPVEFRAVKQHP
jgi:hypothetical protein